MWQAPADKLRSATACLILLFSLNCGSPSNSPTDPVVEGPVTPAVKLFLSDDFESGDFSKWTQVQNLTDVVINSDSSHVRSGTYSAQIRYSLCSTCGDAHQDVNRYMQAGFDTANGFPNGIHHVFVRGSIFFKTPEPGGSVQIQRKIFYIKSPGGEGGVPNSYWAVILTSDGVLSTPNRVQPYLLVVNNSLGGTTTRLWTGSDTSEQLEFDRWYEIELEVRANTPGTSDGRVALWLNGTKIFENSSLNLRLDSPLGINRIEVGTQADRADYLPVEEYRYWDNVQIADGFLP